MLSSFTVSALGVICLVLFGVFYWLGIMATTRAVLAFVGTCLLGTSGFIGGALQAIGSWLVNLANSGTAWATGIAVGGTALVIVAGVVFVHDLMPKHTAGKRTGCAGILLAALLIAGVSGIQALNNVPAGVRNGVTNIQSVLGG
jgi:hypothetical protein